jgi:6-phosphogluconolactonase (cycloisomerase 2 family)
VDAGTIRSYRLNTSSGSLAEVSGSPASLPPGSSTGGSLVASHGFVYAVNRPGNQFAVAMYTFQADPSTGALTPVGSPITVTSQADSNVGKIVLSGDGNTAYVLSQFTVYIVVLNNGSPSLMGSQQLSNGNIWGFGIAGSFAYAGIQDGNPKTGFAQPVLKRMAKGADGSLGPSQAIVTFADSNFSSDLATDANGRLVAATTGFNNDHVSVWSVNSSTGDLAPVPGSPFSNNGDIGKLLRFDPSGAHLYLINNPDFEPRHEDVVVFSADRKGTLALEQTLDLGNGQHATDFKVEDEFAFITNGITGGQGAISVLRIDPSSGQIAVASTTGVSSLLGGIATLHF